jgi:hypothetical protein
LHLLPITHFLFPPSFLSFFTDSIKGASFSAAGGLSFDPQASVDAAATVADLFRPRFVSALIYLLVLRFYPVGGASALVTFICVLCTLRFAQANLTVKMQLYTLQLSKSDFDAWQEDPEELMTRERITRPDDSARAAADNLVRMLVEHQVRLITNYCYSTLSTIP